MPTPLSDQYLIDYSGEHLLHEINMFWKLSETIQPNEIGFLPSVLIESFAIHLRNLIEFFYFPPESKYVRAREFFDDPNGWKPTMTNPVKAALTRANEEVSHLTHGRKSGMPPDKTWDPVGLLKEIEPVARDFAIRASIKKLHANVRELFKLPSNELRVWLDKNATYSNVASGTITYSV